MSLTDYEKQRRKERRKRREEAKQAGTFVPPKERKAKRRKDLTHGIAERARKKVSKEDTERTLKRQRTTQQDRIEKHTRWRPHFKEGEPALVKVRINRIHLNGAYTVTRIEDLKIDSGYGWYVEERFLTPWPRRRKK